MDTLRRRRESFPPSRIFASRFANPCKDDNVYFKCKKCANRHRSSASGRGTLVFPSSRRRWLGWWFLPPGLTDPRTGLQLNIYSFFDSRNKFHCPHTVQCSIEAVFWRYQSSLQCRLLVLWFNFGPKCALFSSILQWMMISPTRVNRPKNRPIKKVVLIFLIH